MSFFHSVCFLLVHACVMAIIVFFYLRHRRWKRYYLLVSYTEKGKGLNPPGIRMPRGRVYRCTLAGLADARCPLPPADAPVLVYPLFMLSGHSSGTKLERAVDAAYAARGQHPRLFYQPVLGASPWLAKAAAEHLRPLLADAPHPAGVLVVAHGSKMADTPPEPALFCRRLRELLPGTEVALGYFSQQPDAKDVLARMEARHVLVVPFLLTEGIHTTRDLPTPQDAAACGKTLQCIPPAAALLEDFEW